LIFKLVAIVTNNLWSLKLVTNEIFSCNKSRFKLNFLNYTDKGKHVSLSMTINEKLSIMVTLMNVLFEIALIVHIKENVYHCQW